MNEALSQYQLAGDSEHEASALKDIGQIELDQGKYPDVEKRFKQALQLYKSPQRGAGVGRKALLPAPDPISYASLLVSLAKVSRAQQHSGEAESYLREALPILEAAGPANLLAAKVSGQMASLYVDQGQYEKAEPLFNQALPILKGALGPSAADADYAAILQSYAVLLRKTNRSAEAARIEREAVNANKPLR